MSRPSISAALQRQLLIETGYRCAVCKTPEPLEFEHIEDWAKVREHTFDNMIVLCRNCHGRKSNKANPKKLDRISLRKIKNNLAMLNARYSDLEKRLIEQLNNEYQKYSIRIPESLYILVVRLHEDKYIDVVKIDGGLHMSDEYGNVTSHDFLQISLSSEGREFVKNLTL